MHENPIQQFRDVFHLARQRETGDCTAVTLATVGADGQPSARVVLLKDVDERGFVFYTNKRSRKGMELISHPQAALCFYWSSIGQQVRIEGTVEEVSDAESDDYFATRPRGSQLGAWASNQSEEISSREQLLEQYHSFERKFEGGDVPRPPHWGGFLLRPQKIEFWINGEFRLHDRFLYERLDTDAWKIRRLSP